MKLEKKNRLIQAAAVLTTAFLLTAVRPALAQDYPPPPSFSPQQLDNLVSRIALYPDPLLAQVFAAASFPDQIPDAARWAGQYRNLNGNALADAMYQANLPFDPAVQALIPFPSVLDMMAQDPSWTSALGNAVLADRGQVMDAVQRMRRSAEQFGYLQSNAEMRVVNAGPDVEIEPVDPGLIYVPVYDPFVVFAAPRPGFFVGAAIGFGPCYSIGAFGGWGWGGGFNWYNHALIVNHVTWGRTWYNRGVYVHNYGNWDRGAWRNTVVVNRNTSVNNFYREARPNPVTQYSGFERNDRPQFASNYRPAQPARVAQNRGFERNTFQQPRNEVHAQASRPAEHEQHLSAPHKSEGGHPEHGGRR